MGELALYQILIHPKCTAIIVLLFRHIAADLGVQSIMYRDIKEALAVA